MTVVTVVIEAWLKGLLQDRQSDVGRMLVCCFVCTHGTVCAVRVRGSHREMHVERRATTAVADAGPNSEMGCAQTADPRAGLDDYGIMELAG